MTLHLSFIRPTPLARLYRDRAGGEQWVPRSVCAKTLKWPSQNGQPPVHEVEIEDWWLEQNPWPRGAGQKELI